MRRIGLGAAAFALAIVGATAAHAQSMYTATTVELRAGPGPMYPVVVVLPPQVGVSVQGCVGDYSWCDIAAGGYRGWAYAGNINYIPSNGAATAPLMSWGSALNIPVVPFALNNYWGEHYRDRRFYGDRDRYANAPRGGDRRDWDRREAERRDAERRDAERRDAQRRDAQRRDAERAQRAAPGGIAPGYRPGIPPDGADRNP